VLNKPKAVGFRVSLVGGVGAGRIQAQPPAQTKGADGPYVTSGLFNVHAGVRFNYRITRNFGLYFLPVMHIMAPSFLFAIDPNLGAQVAF
jgi:hypothetical protein